MAVCRGLLLFIPFVLGLDVAYPAEEPKPEQAAAKPASTAKPRLKITVSKETTYITEPLRPDGYVDYVAAINGRLSKGVTPENNAAVPLWKAVGPNEIEKDCRNKYFQTLGIAPLPEKGNYFVELDKYVEEQNQRKHPEDAWKYSDEFEANWGRLDLAMKQPWSDEEYPTLAEWLMTNEGPLTLAVEASRRPRYYEPAVVGAAEGPMGTLLQALEPGRLGLHTHFGRSMDRRIGLARALVARAMLRIGEGKVDGAWEDLLACHRLARLVGQGPTLIDALLAMSMDGMACFGDQAFLHHANLNASGLAKMQDELARLAPMPRIADKVDLGERFMFLDAASATARDGLSCIRKLMGAWDSESNLNLLLDILGHMVIDWDVVLRLGNAHYEQVNAAYRRATWSERKRTLATLDDDMRKTAESARDFGSLVQSIFDNPRISISERFGHAFVFLFGWYSSGCNDIECRAIIRFELDQLAFVLAAYRAEHHSYPARLADLTPKFTAKLPKDPFADGDLHYKREGSGYLLYSVGPNAKDDGGRNFWEEHPDGRADESTTDEERSGDDIAIRMSSIRNKKE
jgi:hypothetical protein